MRWEHRAEAAYSPARRRLGNTVLVVYDFA